MCGRVVWAIILFITALSLLGEVNHIIGSRTNWLPLTAQPVPEAASCMCSIAVVMLMSGVRVTQTN